MVKSARSIIIGRNTVIVEVFSERRPHYPKGLLLSWLEDNGMLFLEESHRFG